nr:hypothetical protein SHINE37_43331 [Rhizobiaceae bacterium]
MLVGGIVLPTLNLAGDEPQIGLCQERGDRLFLHEKGFRLVQHLGAHCRVPLLVRLLHERVILDIVELAIVEGLVGADAERQEVLRIRVVGDPAGTRHVERATFLQVGVVRGDVEVHHRDVRAEGVLPHVGNGRRHALVVRVGVVADLDLQRLAALAVAGLLHQLERLILAVELRKRAEIGGRRLIAFHAGGHHGIGRELRARIDFLGQEVAVDSHGERAAHVDVAVGLLSGVEGVVVGRQRRRDMDLLAIARLQPLDLVGGEVVDEVHFLRLEAPDRSGLVVDRVEDHLVELDVRDIPIVLVLLDDQVVVRDMADQLEGAVRHHRAGLDEVGAVLLDAGLGDRKRRLVRKQLEEEGRRPLQRHFQRRGIDGLEAELVEAELTLVDLFRVLDRIEDIGIARRGLRVFHAGEGEDEVFRRHRGTVRPLRVLAQLERIDRAVVGDGPAFRGAGNDLAGRVIDRQALVEVLEDELLDVDGSVRLVEGLRFAGIAAVKHRFCKSRTGAQQDCARKKSRTKANESVCHFVFLPRLLFWVPHQLSLFSRLASP